MKRISFVRPTIGLLLAATVILGAAGCLLVPAPVPGPVVAVPGPPVVVVPGPSYGYYGYGYGYGRYGRRW